jgi:hypothetical protein
MRRRWDTIFLLYLSGLALLLLIAWVVNEILRWPSALDIMLPILLIYALPGVVFGVIIRLKFDLQWLLAVMIRVFGRQAALVVSGGLSVLWLGGLLIYLPKVGGLMDELSYVLLSLIALRFAHDAQGFLRSHANRAQRD